MIEVYTDMVITDHSDHKDQRSIPNMIKGLETAGLDAIHKQ